MTSSNDVAGSAAADVTGGGEHLRTVELAVCQLCLDGVGGECHVPGCVFWMHDAPDVEVAAVLREHSREMVCPSDDDAPAHSGEGQP